MNACRAVGFVAGSLLCSVALGQVTLGPITRYIRAQASAGAGATSDQHDATGYGVFDDQVTVSASNPPIASGSGLARQTSSIQPVGNELQFSITGRVFGSGFGPMTTGNGSGKSVAILDFTVTQDVPWRLLTSMTQSTNLSFQTATSSLQRLSPAPVTLADHSYWFLGPQSSSGTLTPGSYRFVTNFDCASPEEGSAELNYSVLLAIPSGPGVGLMVAAGVWAGRRRRS